MATGHNTQNIIVKGNGINPSIEDQDRVFHAFRYSYVGQCVNGVTHDVNNLLGAILANAELIELESELSPAASKMIGDIVDAVRESSNILGAVTEIARPAKRIAVMVDPAASVRRVASLKRYDMKIGRGDLSLDIEGELPSFIGDRPGIQQALLYLFSNSLEAVKDTEHRQIRLGACRDGDAVEFSVWNAGPEILESEREIIFEDFYTTKGNTHLGLGLSLARRTAREHDGDLIYDGERGFVMRLPINNRFADKDA